MFKVEGATVYPSEVEAALRSVAGRPSGRTSPTWAAPRSAPLVIVGPAGSPSRRRRDARNDSSAFKVPTRWLVITDADSVPMTATGKVDKAALRELRATSAINV